MDKNIHHCIYLQRAWNKYGSDNFDFVIEEYPLTLEKAVERELYHLVNFKEKLYNTSRLAGGGDLISYHPNRGEIVTKMKASLASRYQKLSDEEKKKIYGRSGKKNGMFGKTHNEHIRQVISQKRKV